MLTRSNLCFWLGDRFGVRVTFKQFNSVGYKSFHLRK